MNAVRAEFGKNEVGSRGKRHPWGLFFSIYLAFAIVSAAVLRGVFLPFVHLAQIINIRLGRPTGNPTGGYAAFFIFVILLTALLALLFGLLGRISRIGQPLRYFALITTLAAAPLCWFYVARWHGWFPLEVIAFSVLVLLAVFAHWRIPFGVYGVAFSLHFGFWGLRFWQFTHNPAEILLPFFGFCASIVWISSSTRECAKLHHPEIG